VTTSGVAAFNMNFAELAEEAWSRCGAEIRSGWDFRTTRISLNLLLADWANRGLNLWSIEEGAISMAAGVGQYALPDDTVDLIEHVVRTSAGSVSGQTDIAISRISVSTYASIPNKLVRGRPIQIFIERRSGVPSPLGNVPPRVNVWPVPDGSQPYTLVYWRLRRLQDIETGLTSADVPFRFLPCMIAGLAYHLALKVPGGLERLGILKEQYDAAWDHASSEDRDRSSVRFVPRSTFYR
jgi:hypothetical protein